MVSKQPSSAKPAANAATQTRMTEISTGRWLLGMAMATTFSFVYFVSPTYMISAVLCLLFQYPTMEWSFVIAAPLILSVLSKPQRLDCRFLKPMADYFDFETAFEITDDEIRELLKTTDKRFILASQPHGVVSDVCFHIVFIVFEIVS
jgi:hypothetical protein